MNIKLGMLDFKLDKLQDNHERLEADMSTVSSDVKNGFYKVKHQIRKLEDQGATYMQGGKPPCTFGRGKGGADRS